MAMMAVAKFKAGGRRNHETWLAEKEAERREEFEVMRMLREMDESESQKRAAEDAKGRAHFADIRLEQMKQAREGLKTNMLQQTGQLGFVPSRPTSSVGKHQRAELVGPSEQEQWALGLDILKLQDMLDAAAPGLNAAAADAAADADTATYTDDGQPLPKPSPRKRSEQFPKKLPAVPTHDTVKGLRKGAGRSGGFSGAARSKSAVRLKKLERSPAPPNTEP